LILSLDVASVYVYVVKGRGHAGRGQMQMQEAAPLAVNVVVACMNRV
jgi:hypothetical protein